MINLAKFYKGTTSIKELDEMPVRMVHVMYKEYIKTMLDEEARKAHGEGQAAEELQDQLM